MSEIFFAAVLYICMPGVGCGLFIDNGEKHETREACMAYNEGMVHEAVVMNEGASAVGGCVRIEVPPKTIEG